MTATAFRVLIVGGTGVFGSRLVDAALASTDWEIIVAGRDAARTRSFAECRGARVSAVVLDARRCSPADLARTGAHAVVDAAGPFQGASYHLALAAAKARLHYVDIADARDFVGGFTDAVDAAATEAGVVALTGASTTPALSSAALDDITAGWRRVDDTLTVVLPGNRAPRGLSVVRAILSYAGRPVRVFMGGRWTTAPGWGLTRRVMLPGLGRRWASLCETPDLDVMPARYPDAATSLFLAGLELSVLHLGLAAASLAVRWGLAPTLVPLAPLARAASRALFPFGTDRGGMLVEALGVDAHGRRSRARLTLVAAAGEGPSVPIFPALAALRAIAAGRLHRPGARICVDTLTLPEIEAEFTGRPISTTRAHDDPGPELFPGALGAKFGHLPVAVADLHRPGRISRWFGRASIDGADTPMARLVARAFRFPPAGLNVPVMVTIAAEHGGEIWTRDFAGRSFRSLLRRGRAIGEVEETFGLLSFKLALTADGTGIAMRVVGWRLGPVPLPRWLMIGSDARETQDGEGRFRFDVAIDLPLRLGRVVRYAGWLSRRS